MRVTVCLVIAACGGARPAGPKLPTGEHRAEIDGVEISYQVRGNGPPCVVMPGGPGLSADYLHSKELEQHVTAIYIDPAGTGASQDLPSTEVYSIRRDVQILEALRVDLKLERWCVIGHSYGGFVALRYALDWPQHTTALMLYSTSPSLGDEFQKQVGERLQMFKDEAWFADATKALEEEANAKNPQELEAVVRRELPLYFAEWTARHEEYDPKLESFKVDFEVFRRRPDAKFEVRAELSKLRVPTVIVVGDRDFLFGPAVGAWLANGIAKSKLVTIEKAGHLSHLEQPQQFGAAVETLAKLLD
jgi:proline-specific peptidase